MKLWRLHLRSPFNWLYNILLVWNSWSIWAEGRSTSQPMFTPALSGLRYRMKSICRVYFVLVTFWRQRHHSWPSTLRLPKTQWRMLCNTCTDWSHSISSSFTHYLCPGFLVVGVSGMASNRAYGLHTGEPFNDDKQRCKYHQRSLPEQKELLGRLHAALHIALK